MTVVEVNADEVQRLHAEAFFFADHTVVVGGKVYVNGGFWTKLSFPSYPATVPPIALVAALRVPARMYQSDHVLKVSLEDPDKRELPGFRAEGRFRVGAAPQMEFGEPTTLPMAMPVVGLSIEKPGTYIFVLRVDDQEIARLSVQAMQVANFQQAFRFTTPPGAPPQNDG